MRTPFHAFAEYIALEAASEVEHEYVNGEIFAMAGGSTGADTTGKGADRHGSSMWNEWNEWND